MRRRLPYDRTGSRSAVNPNSPINPETNQPDPVELTGSFATAPAAAGSGSAAAALPATIPYTTIAQYEAKEPKVVKTTTKPLTNKEKLEKALKACKKDKSKGKRVKCEAAAHKKYPVAKKKGKKK
jgi:hypothetical protein